MCAALVSLISALGKISGGHFNPAVTLAVVLSGRHVCSAADGLLYGLVQLLGGLCAGLLVAVFHMHGAFRELSFTPLPLKPFEAYSIITVGIAEGVFTFVLAYVALASTVRDAKSQVGAVSRTDGETMGKNGLERPQSGPKRWRFSSIRAPEPLLRPSGRLLLAHGRLRRGWT